MRVSADWAVAHGRGHVTRRRDGWPWIGRLQVLSDATRDTERISHGLTSRPDCTRWRFRAYHGFKTRPRPTPYSRITTYRRRSMTRTRLSSVLCPDEAVSLVSSLPCICVRTYHITYPSAPAAFVVASRISESCSSSAMTSASTSTFCSLTCFSARQGSHYRRLWAADSYVGGDLKTETAFFPGWRSS